MKQDGQTTAQTTAFTLLRVGVGIIMMAHGWQKLSDPASTIQGFASAGVPAPEVSVYLAIAGEFFGGLGLLLGLLTKLAALGPAFTMVGAILFVHLGNGLMASNNGWEYPLVLLLVSLLFVASGPGPVSVDARLAKRRERQRTRGAQSETYASHEHTAAPRHPA